MESFFEVLKKRRNKRVELLYLRTLWLELHPEQQEHPNRDSLILEALHVAAHRGLLKLPAPRSFESFGSPAMPRFVTMNIETITAIKIDWAAIPWRPELGFWMNLTESEKATAKVINEWLIQRDGCFQMVPMRERSLDIFGNEKFLDLRVKGSSLFSGRLPLAVIGAERVDMPLAYRPSPGLPGRPVLVIENHHTFASLGAWNVETGRYAAVVYGSGNAFTSTGTALDEVLLEVEGAGAEYFGDLDPTGISIPLRYNRDHSIQLRPAIWLYRLLQDFGRARPLDVVVEAGTERVEDWLPEQALEILALWKEGLFLPQEGVGRELLFEMNGRAKRF